MAVSATITVTNQPGSLIGREVRRALGQRRDLAGVRTVLQSCTGEVGEQPALVWRGAGDRSERRGLARGRMKAPDVAPCRGQASVHDAHRQPTVAAGQRDAIQQPQHRRATGGIERGSVPGGNRGGEAHLLIGSDTRGLQEAIGGLGAPEALLGSSKLHQDRHPRVVLRWLRERTAQKRRGGGRRAAGGRPSGSLV